MEETWKKTSDDQVLMISDSDMDPHEFSAQNRGKFTERSQKSPLRALYEAGNPVIAEEDIGLERVAPDQESSGAALRDVLQGANSQVSFARQTSETITVAKAASSCTFARKSSASSAASKNQAAKVE